MKDECNLCMMLFDKFNIHGIKRHEDWHTNCKINKRNTVEGIVVWREKDE